MVTTSGRGTNLRYMVVSDIRVCLIYLNTTILIMGTPKMVHVIWRNPHTGVQEFSFEVSSRIQRFSDPCDSSAMNPQLDKVSLWQNLIKMNKAALKMIRMEKNTAGLRKKAVANQPSDKSSQSSKKCKSVDDELQWSLTISNWT